MQGIFAGARHRHDRPTAWRCIGVLILRPKIVVITVQHYFVVYIMFKMDYFKKST